MRQRLNRLSFALVIVATALVAARWIAPAPSVVEARQDMGAVGFYSDWTNDIEGTIYGFSSGYETDPPGCDHYNYVTSAVLTSPTRSASLQSGGTSSNVTLQWEQEEGWWSVGGEVWFDCSCGGALSAGWSSTSFDLTPAAAPDPQKLQQCLNACAQGITAIENFCRSLPNFPPAMRAVKMLCWASRWSQPLCQGFCYAIWGE
jgi:hypothetical protein